MVSLSSGAGNGAMSRERQGKAEQEEVRKLDKKRAIVPVRPRQDQFTSQIFVVPKKDGTQRPAVNLKPFNHLVVKQKFKMEGIRAVRDLIKKNDRMVSIDLKDTYLSVTIFKDHRKFLRFIWKDVMYRIPVPVPPIWLEQFL